MADEREFSRSVGSQEQRKLRARRPRSPIWSGLGMLGIVGWSVGGPTVLGALLGTVLDRRHPGSHSWTLTLLIAGLCVGAINIAHWMAQEQRGIHREEDEE